MERDVLALRKQYGMSRAEFCRYFNIPIRTVEDWDHGKRKCPDYLYDLMEYKLSKEKQKKGEA